MQHTRKKGIIYQSTGAVREFQIGGIIADPTQAQGTSAGNMLRKVSGYGKNLLKNRNTWGDGSRINARRAMKQFDKNASTAQKTDMAQAKMTGDYGGYFKNQGDALKESNIGKFESPSFKPKPSQTLNPSNYTMKEGKLTSTQPDAMTAAGQRVTQPVVDKSAQALDAVGAGAQGAAAALKPAAGGFEGNAGAYAAAGNIAGGLLQGIDDGKDYKYSDKEKIGTVGGGMLKGAAMGASVGAMFGGAGAVPGAIIGAVGGLISGLFSKGKKKKAAKKALAAKTTNEANRANAARMNELVNQDQQVAGAPVSTLHSLPAAPTPGQFIRRKTGGTFSPIEFNESTSANRIIKKKAADVLTPKKFKRGGSIKPTENIIPAGVLHEENNELGDKGMPVVKCNKNTCEKKYEIEKDEMIFTLTATKQTEELVGKKDYSKLGKFVKTQILDNTHSFTDKYNELNNM